MHMILSKFTQNSKKWYYLTLLVSFSLNMSVVIPSICNFRKCEFNGCIIFKKIGDLCEHFMQKWTQ